MSNKICRNCNEELKSEAQFCSKCGTAVASVKKKKNSVSKKPRSGSEYLIIAAIIVVVVIVYNFSSFFSESGEVVNEPQPTPVVGNNFSSIVQQGHMFMDRGFYDNAILQYTSALSIDSMHPEVIVDLGACYHALGENDKAIFQFKRALTLDPKQPIAMFNMGVVGISVGDSAMTRQWWNEYLKVADESPQTEMVRKQLENF